MVFTIVEPPHVETVCQLVREATNSGIQTSDETGKSRETAEAKDGMKRKINYREEEIPDCGCIYG